MAEAGKPASAPEGIGVASGPDQISDEALRKAEEFIEADEGATNRLTGLAGQAVTGDRGRDVAVPSLCGGRRRLAVQRFPDHLHPAAALRARRVRAGPELPAVSDGGAVPQPHPLVRCRARLRGRRDPRLRDRGRRGLHRPRHDAEPNRHRARHHLHRAAARGDAAHHRLDRAGRRARFPRLRVFRSVPAAALDASRLRHRADRRPAFHHARRHFRHSGRCFVEPDRSVLHLRRVPAALGRGQVLHRFLARADGQQAERRGPHRRAFLVPARRSVRAPASPPR